MRCTLSCPFPIIAAIGAIAGVIAGHVSHGAGILEYPWCCWLAALVWVLFKQRWRGLTLLIVVALGLVAAQRALDHQLAPGLARQLIRLDGIIERVEKSAAMSLHGRGQPPRTFYQLTFRVRECAPLDKTLPACHRLQRVRLGWLAAPEPRVGQRWRLTARVKPAHAAQNPGLWPGHWRLLRQAMGANGSVQRQPEAVLIAEPPHGPVSWLGRRIDEQLNEGRARRWAHGLLLGDGNALITDDWQLLNDSGTTHLMVVSGMHIGVAMGGTLWLSRRLLRVLQPRRYRLSNMPRWLCLGAGLGYVVISGSGPAAVRAFIMALAVAYGASGGYSLRLFSGWWLALAYLLLSDPLLIYRPGLWFSFLAVAALMIGWRWRPRQHGLLALLHTQLTLGILLDGAVMLAFGRWMPVSLVANLLAIPWVTLVLLPVGLLALGVGLACPDWASGLVWWCFSRAVQLQHGVLSWLALRWPPWQMAGQQQLVLGCMMMMIGWLWLLPGVGKVFRGAATLMLVCLWWLPAPANAPAQGALELTLYDIGQGQLMEIRTRRHRLLYDSGPRYPSGQAPLEGLWPPGQYFDLFMLSHADSDHSGGVASLFDLHRVATTLAPLRESLRLPRQQAAALDFRGCRAGQHWQWDGVSFKVLWPRAEEALPAVENERSCVLLIEAHRQRVLVLGDAPESVEKRLLQQLQFPLSVIVSGHHGSNSSSSRALMIRARPRHVLHTAGFLNAYRHPADKVIRRLDTLAQCQWNTALDGAINVSISASGVVLSRQSTRYAVEPACVGVSSPAER